MNKKNHEITAILLATLSIFIFLSLIQFKSFYSISDVSDLFQGTSNHENWPITGALGASLAALLKKWFLGHGSFLLCSILWMYSYVLFTRKDYRDSRYTKLAFYQLSLGVWLAVFFAWLGGDNTYDSSSGVVGYILKEFLGDMLSNFVYILLPIIFIIILRGFINFSFYNIYEIISSFIKQFFSKIKSKEPIIQDYEDEGNNQDVNDIINDTETFEEDIPEDIQEDIETHNSDDDSQDIIIEEEDLIDEGDIDLVNKKKYDKYKLPSSTLLNSPVENQASQSDDELKEKATQLIHALETFGVQGEVIRISPGPVITLFEIEPAEGVRVNKFVTLSDDLARVMQAQRIRVIAPIPGSRSVGVELPNDNPQMVFLQTILNSEKYINSDSKLTIAIGKTTTGDAFTFDLNKLPHLLIAGATGAGKSVCINTIIMSILYKAKPDEVKFILIDPKKLELSTYKKLVGYHLTTAPNLDEYVMTTADNALGILDASIHEMERRFSLFADVGVRNIEEYHNRSSLDNAMEKIPYLVILIDELADLMMTSAKAIEDPITRLAQKARAVGIHLVVATQRPSVDVITGLIKSNFPARLSFQVSQRVDSRTILDQMGAEKLLGKGDLLFLKPGSSSPIRLHNAFITLDEIEKVLLHINEQPKPDEIKLPEAQKKSRTENTHLNEEHDELLLDAAKLVVDTGQASVSLLQRKFRIGYARAGRLIDELEALGIITGHSGSKAREVLVDYAYIDNLFKE